jgi:hypothetical protein
VRTSLWCHKLSVPARGMRRTSPRNPARGGALTAALGDRELFYFAKVATLREPCHRTTLPSSAGRLGAWLFFI